MQNQLSILVLYVNVDFYLVFRVRIWRDTGNFDFIDIVQPHVQILGDVVVGVTWDEAQFVVAEVNGNCVRVKSIVSFTYQLQIAVFLQKKAGAQ